MKEYTDEELIEYFKELTIQSNEPNHQYRSVKYDKDRNILNVYITFIKDEKYSEFFEKLLDLGFKGKIKFVLYKDEEEEHNRFDKFLKHLEKYEQEIGIENIYLEGNFQISESDFFKKVQHIFLAEFTFGTINQFIDKFPNLKTIDFQDYQYGGDKFDVDLDGLLTALKYISTLKIKIKNSYEEIQQAVNNDENLKDKIIILNDGKFFINLGRRDENSHFITISLNDLNTKFDLIDSLIKQGYGVTLSIPDARALSVEQAERLRPFIKKVEVYSADSMDSPEHCEYDLDTYIAIREKLDELVEGIDLNLPEKERFAEVYYRICKSIVYDHKALPENAVTPEDKKYVKEVDGTCRNLENGLLYGKCVCAGYAEILRNALFMVNIDNVQVSGTTKNARHAWNKVKLDGVWYNVDATWDAPDISREIVPTHCLKSDKFIEKKDGKKYFEGPECFVDLPKREIDNLFVKKGLYKITWFDDFIEDINIIGAFISRKLTSLKDAFIRKKEQKSLPDIVPNAEKNGDSDEDKTGSWKLEKYGTTQEEVNNKIQETVLNNNSKKGNLDKIKDDERSDL